MPTFEGVVKRVIIPWRSTVIRFVGRILAGHGALKPEVLQRVVPSTVLLSAIRYKGVLDGLDAQFVLDFNSLSDVRTATAMRATLDPQWRILRRRAGVSAPTPASERLAKPIRMVFEESKRAADLEPKAPPHAEGDEASVA